MWRTGIIVITSNSWGQAWQCNGLSWRLEDDAAPADLGAAIQAALEASGTRAPVEAEEARAIEYAAWPETEFPRVLRGMKYVMLRQEGGGEITLAPTERRGTMFTGFRMVMSASADDPQAIGLAFADALKECRGA